VVSAAAMTRYAQTGFQALQLLQRDPQIGFAHEM
jgi:hypothetical protein